MRSAEPGRRALLDAGRRLLVSEDLARLSVNAIIGEANMAKGSFYQHWPTRRDYLLALHRTFHDQLMSAVDMAIEGLPPGLDRIATGMTTYLDECLTCPAAVLLVAAIAEIALHEMATGHRRDDLRSAALSLAAHDPTISTGR